MQLKLANLEIPAVIREFTDQQMMEFAILENLQREDLTPIEEAEAYQNLNGKSRSYTRTTCINDWVKVRPHIANHVRLLIIT